MTTEARDQGSSEQISNEGSEKTLENTLPDPAATDSNQLSTPSHLLTALQREQPDWVTESLRPLVK